MPMAYLRFFMPLLHEAKGYEFKGRTPAGRCIIEERSDMGKISLWVQNLKEQTKYGIYLIFAEGRRYAGVHMGLLDVNANGKAEFRRDLTPGELHMYSLSDLVAVAVIVTNAAGVVSPLCGYQDQQVSWRHSFFIKKSDTALAAEKPTAVTPPVVKNPLPAIEKVMSETPVEIHAPPRDIEDMPMLDTPLINLVREPLAEEPPQMSNTPPTVETSPPIDTRANDENTNLQNAGDIAFSSPQICAEPDDMPKMAPPSNDTCRLREELPISPPRASRPQSSEVPVREATPIAKIPHIMDINDKNANLQESSDTHQLQEELTISPPMASRPQPLDVPPPDPPEPFTQDPPPLAPPRATKPPGAVTIRHNQPIPQPSPTPTQSRESTIQLLEAIFNANTPIEPFAKQNRPIKWVRCNQFEQMPIPGSRPNLADERFMLNSWESYKHFIVGITMEGEPLQYIIGIAGVYTPEDKERAMQLGFAQFKGVKKDPTRIGDDGYWLMFVDF